MGNLLAWAHTEAVATPLLETVTTDGNATLCLSLNMCSTQEADRQQGRQMLRLQKRVFALCCLWELQPKKPSYMHVYDKVSKLDDERCVRGQG